MIPQRIHDALIAILREHQPKDAAALLIDLEELIVRELAARQEAYALVCDAISADKHAQFKGQGDHLTSKIHRGDPYTEGESDGADQCAAAIRARTEGGANRGID